jgi:hypothetical protein
MVHRRILSTSFGFDYTFIADGRAGGVGGVNK